MKKDKSNNLSQYSVLDSTINVDRSGAYPVIKKITKLHSEFEGQADKIISYIMTYIEELSLAGVKMPKMINKNFNGNKLTFLCEYAGDNIVDMVRSDKINDTLLNTDIFEQMFVIMKKIQKDKLYFDPHPKNYVILNGRISYVDFTPPWIEEYFILRLSRAKGKEVEILQDFFECMNFKELGFHLAGDLIKLDKNNYKSMPILYKQLKKRRLIYGSYEKFIIKAESIIKKEKMREINNIFLL